MLSVKKLFVHVNMFAMILYTWHIIKNFEWNKNTLVSEFTITYLNLYGQELSQIFKVEILFDDLKDFDIDNPDEIKINKIN